MTTGNETIAEVTARASRRDPSVDALRGVAVLLVVVFHTESVMQSATAPPSWLIAFNDCVGPMRMPTLVFLSGTLVPASLEKGTARYFSGKAGRVLWPCLVWSVLCVGLLVGTAPLTHNGFDLGDALHLVVPPVVLHMWFLYNLMAYYALAWLTRGIPPGLVAALMMVGLLLTEVDDDRFAFLGICFFLGAQFRRGDWLRRATSGPVPLAIGAVCVMAIMWLALDRGDIRYEAYVVPLSLGAILGLIPAARLLWPPTDTGPGIFPWAGRESLKIYVVHLPAIIVVSNLVQYLTTSSAVLTPGPDRLRAAVGCGRRGAVRALHRRAVALRVATTLGSCP